MSLTLRLLGGVSLERDGQPVGRRTSQRHRLALLAILALHPAGVGRDRLIALLWPDADVERARHLLSHSLYLLRQDLGDDVLLTAGDALRLNPLRWRCDVRAFEEAVRAHAHARAAELYTGPFLDGFFLARTLDFERWLDGERARLARCFLVALDALAVERDAAGDHTAACDWWRRLAAEDPYNSRTALRLVRALEAAGEVAGALRHASAHAGLLREEMGIAAPDELARELDRLRRIHAGRAQAPVAAPATDHPPSPLSSATGVAAAGPPRPDDAAPTIAVLPFESLSADPDQAYFAAALTDVVTTELARAPDLRVISRMSVVALRAAGRRVPEVARELGAGFVLEGTVLRDRRRVRINVQLIDAARDVHVWVETYDRDLVDVLALQADVAREVARQVGAALRPPSADPPRLVSVPA